MTQRGGALEPQNGEGTGMIAIEVMAAVAIAEDMKTIMGIDTTVSEEGAIGQADTTIGPVVVGDMEVMAAIGRDTIRDSLILGGRARGVIV